MEECRRYGICFCQSIALDTLTFTVSSPFTCQIFDDQINASADTGKLKIIYQVSNYLFKFYPWCLGLNFACKENQCNTANLWVLSRWIQTCIIFDHLTRPDLDEIYLYYALKNGASLSQYIWHSWEDCSPSSLVRVDWWMWGGFVTCLEVWPRY